MRAAVKSLVLWCIGGLIYICCELLFRGHSHWTMFIVGGICFVLIGAINELIPWEMPVWQQAGIGAVIVTIIEFVSGCIINLWLGWDVWDYSDMPLNILGQICLPFTVIWLALAIVAIILDDYLRYWLFKEEKPFYTISYERRTKSDKH